MSYINEGFMVVWHDDRTHQIAREIDRAAIQKFYRSQFQRRRRGERRRDDFPASDRSPYTRGARDALTEVERVCRKEMEFLGGAKTEETNAT
jgi:hypothetical protein